MWRDALTIRRWRELRLTGKFALVFGLLLFLVFAIVVISYLSLSAVRQEMEQAILTDAEIQSAYARIDQIGQRTKVALALLAGGGGRGGALGRLGVEREYSAQCQGSVGCSSRFSGRRSGRAGTDDGRG